MPYDQILSRLKQLLDGAEGFSARVLFDFGAAGAVHVDGSRGSIKVSQGKAAAECTLTMPAETFARILRGEVDESTAFMQGDMRIAGEVGLATHISDFIRRRAQAQAATLQEAESK